MDHHGVEHFRWLSRGGNQITGRRYTDHARRCCEAWRMREAVQTHAGEVYRVASLESKTLRLPRVGT